jgi:hypothetical protein
MKAFYTLLILFSLIFLSSCSEEEDNINPVVNNGSINDVAGTWNYLGEFDINNNPINEDSPQSICASQNYMILEASGNAIYTSYYLENEIDGDCIFENGVFQFIYVNSNSLTFIIPQNECGNPTISVNNNQMKWYWCNGDSGTFIADYMLFEKQ